MTFAAAITFFIGLFVLNLRFWHENTVRTYSCPNFQNSSAPGFTTGEASPWFALRCSPPPRLRGHPLKPPAPLQKNAGGEPSEFC